MVSVRVISARLTASSARINNVSMPYKQFLGYEKGEDGKPRIVPEQAKIVKMIYRMFVEGMMPPPSPPS